VEGTWPQSGSRSRADSRNTTFDMPGSPLLFNIDYQWSLIVYVRDIVLPSKAS